MTLNDYFIPGFGISRLVIQRDIKFHLGPQTIVRPYTYHGRDGFLISTPGGAPTKAQLEDIQEASKRFEEQQAAKVQAQETQGDCAFINAPVRVFQTGSRR